LKRVACGLLPPAVFGLAVFLAGILVRPLPAVGEGSSAQKVTNVLEGIDRRIVKEPKYASSPRYLLLVLGANAETKVWVVEDGKSLYVDKNANGDLTDDGPPLAPTKLREFNLSEKGKSWDFEYVLDKIVPSGGSKHTDFCLRRWNYGDKEDQYGLSLTLNGKTPMYAGWTIHWGTSPQTAPAIHFGGALRPQILRRKEFILGSGTNRLSLSFYNPGLGKGGDSRLSIDALPRNVVPELEIDWPVAEGAPPLHTSHQLTERCCYWEFYDLRFVIPPGAVAGTATVKVSVPTEVLPLKLAIDQIKLPVRAKQPDKAAK
jgi:hypothetical protein